MDTFQQQCRSRLLALALAEDCQVNGDITTHATIAPEATGRAVIRAKADGILSGSAVASEVFRLCDPAMVMEWHFADGDHLSAGSVILDVSGRMAQMLVAERTALNFMQRMSGIATRTREFVDAVSHTGAVILDTRKTAPGLRFFDKAAVLDGGGCNHRFGLFDMVLIKDNHSDAAGGVDHAIRSARAYCKEHHLDVPLEVEVRTMQELDVVLGCQPDIILLDNFSLETLREAVGYARCRCGVLLEASGNIGMHNVAAVAETGVDRISVGELTHSVRALDLSMTLRLE